MLTQTLTRVDPLEDEAAFLADWSHGRPIVEDGTDTHTDRGAGHWYRCGHWRVRAEPATIARLLRDGYATGTGRRFVVRRRR